MKKKTIKKKSRALIWLKQLFNFAFHNYVADEAQKKKYFKQRIFNEAQIQKWAKQNKDQVEKAKELIVKQAKYQKLSAWNRQSLAHRTAYYAARAAKGYVQGAAVDALSKNKYASTLMKSYKYLNKAVKIAEIGRRIIQTYKKWNGLKQRFDRTKQNYKNAGSLVGKGVRYGYSLIKRLHAYFTGQQYIQEPEPEEVIQQAQNLSDKPKALSQEQIKVLQQQKRKDDQQLRNDEIKMKNEQYQQQLQRARQNQIKIRQFERQQQRIRQEKQKQRNEELRKALEQKEQILRKQRQSLGKKRNLRF